MNKPDCIKAIYDNTNTDNPTLDCMTFVLNYSDGPNNELTCLCTSHDGGAFSQFSRCMDGSHLGNSVTWESLKPELQEHVRGRLL